MQLYRIYFTVAGMDMRPLFYYMKKLITLLLVTLLIAGCATTNRFISTLKENPSLTLAEAEQKLGKPTQARKTDDSHIAWHLYGTPRSGQVSVFFVNDKLYKYDIDSPLFNLNTAYDLNLISKEEYYSRFEQIRAAMLYEEYQRAVIQAQEDAICMQLLTGMITQQQQSNLQNRQIYQPLPIQPIQPYQSLMQYTQVRSQVNPVSARSATGGIFGKYNPNNPMSEYTSPMGKYNPNNPMSEYTNPMGSMNPMNPMSEVTNPLGKYNPNNPMSEISNPLGKLNPNNPMSEVSSPLGKFNPNNPMSEGIHPYYYQKQYLKDDE